MQTDAEFINDTFNSLSGNLNREDVISGPSKKMTVFTVPISEYPNGMFSQILGGSGMRGKKGQLEKVIRCLLAGESIRATVRITRSCRKTVRRAMTVVKVYFGVNPICKCGRASGHQGWCSVRFYKSQKRQQFIKIWKLKKQNK